MKSIKAYIAIFSVVLLLAACSPAPETVPENAVQILLADTGITVDGAAVSADPTSAVYKANDIVYYEAGKDFTYGEGKAADAHSPEEAAAHTVVHITKPGTYSLSGKLSKGQIAVDLGEGAKEDPAAVVTLILNGVDITCEVAPAVIFYNVYECGSKEEDKAAKDVNTAAAGASVIIADGTENIVNGSYVARIYQPDTVVLNEAGTEVEDAKKLHKYDAAFYSKMSMNVSGQKEGTGKLHIRAANEGLDSELHLTLNGGNIDILSGNDGINTNEDGISVTTVNGGNVTIRVTGETGEGDGIDSNGWLVINGGTVIAQACSNSADAGIDSDMGIHINGGTVMATGHMLDRIEAGGQNYAVFNFAQKQTGGKSVSLHSEGGEVLQEFAAQNAYSVLIYSSPELNAGSYTLWSDGQQLATQKGGGFGGSGMGMGGMKPPEGMERPDGMTPPEGMERPEEQKIPEGMEKPQRPDFPNGGGERPDGGFKPEQNAGAAGEMTTEFQITDGGNMFRAIAPAVSDL